MMNILKEVKLIALFIMLLSINYSCEKEDNIIKPPSVPILLEPTKGLVINDSTVTFQWQSTDDDNIRYTLFVGEDTVQWKEIIVNNVSSYELSSTNNPEFKNYYVFEKGKTYYWKVKAERYSYEDDTPILNAGETMSDIFHFYTIPPGVNNLRNTYGNEFVKLYWDDPENADRIEISFEPEVNGISQPVTINAGVSTYEFDGLNNETIYSFYVKVYDKLSHVSEIDTLKAMPLLPSKVHDVDFNIYNTVTIGTQIWLKENLRVTKFNDGSPFINGYGELYEVDNFIGSESEKYGLYYYSVIASGGHDYDKNVCPCGYHVPSDNEWKVLESYLGMTDEDLNNTSYYIYRGETENVGSSLKSATGWNDYNGESGNGSDMYGLSILPSGYIDSHGVEIELGTTGILWSSTTYTQINVDRIFSNSSTGIRRAQSGGGIKFPIRCIKD